MIHTYKKILDSTSDKIILTLLPWLKNLMVLETSFSYYFNPTVRKRLMSVEVGLVTIHRGNVFEKN